jgi:hypothetical protein
MAFGGPPEKCSTYPEHIFTICKCQQHHWDPCVIYAFWRCFRPSSNGKGIRFCRRVCMIVRKSHTSFDRSSTIGFLLVLERGPREEVLAIRIDDELTDPQRDRRRDMLKSPCGSDPSGLAASIRQNHAKACLSVEFPGIGLDSRLVFPLPLVHILSDGQQVD